MGEDVPRRLRGRRTVLPTKLSTSTFRLFVYGTLLRGESNHALLGDARLLCEASTRPAYELVDAGEYPAMLAGGSTCVRGELYEVLTSRLDEIDAYEGAPELFERVRVDLSDGSAATGYVMSRPRAAHLPRIDGGSWLRFRRGSAPA